jgi:hypothetical protein
MEALAAWQKIECGGDGWHSAWYYGRLIKIKEVYLC